MSEIGEFDPIKIREHESVREFRAIADILEHFLNHDIVVLPMIDTAAEFYLVIAQKIQGRLNDEAFESLDVHFDEERGAFGFVNCR